MSGLRVLLGLLLAGYGLLVVVGVLPHDALLAGVLSLALGLILLIPGLPPLRLRRASAVAALGALAAGGVLLYAFLVPNGMSVPEWAILGYGLALLAAAPHLGRKAGRVEVGTLVAWSFPLLLAPLALFALNGSLSGGGAAAATPVVEALIVHPTAFALRAIGTPVALDGNSMVLPTERGTLVLTVGLVCAGLYPIVLFLGLLAMHVVHKRVPPRRAAGLLAGGLALLWCANVLRLAILTKVGQRYGPAALQTAHANLGWVLFAVCMVVFWAVALRPRPQTPPPPASA